ncbi:Wzz/FepE/Etk N-terminal domain-containing protein [Metabacillus sp. GX 13764]|uniref:YveK family protein n=1 Tax=Metabacillus kandeliae TaxID=2900151 RepID=UPI001E5A4E1F|nr:Wzz/FepE/Etk N-terminal domain-containing protein [Metabacillus kandeliae]MCD7033134.1 Wzz/FepE/Etk N-terminal domain-containing protein [Metabacillus kandeliae]
MEKEIDLKKLFNVLLLRKWLLVSVTFLFAATGYFLSAPQDTAYYSATGKVLIKDDGKLTGTLLAMFNEPVILKEAAAKLKLKDSPETLSSQVSAVQKENSQIVYVTVTDYNKNLAIQKANAVMEAYQDNIPKVLNFNQIKILDPAKYSQEITSSPMKTIFLFTAIGLILSIGLIFLLDSLDSSIRTEHEAEQILEMAVLGSIAKANRRNAPINKKSKLNAIVRGESVAGYDESL